MNLKRFISFLKYTLLTAVVLTTVGISGCDDDDDDKPTKTIWELVQADASLSSLEEQLLAGGVDTELSAAGSFTLFAPSDQAMNTLLTTLGLDNFSSISDDVIEAVLAYHILESQKLYAELSGNLETMQGESITVISTTTGEKQLDTGATDDAGITTKDIKATNGVIHIINTVIVPPTIGALIVQTLGTVAQPLLLASDFTTLSAAILKADAYAAANSQPTIVSILIDEEIITVFAPTNAVFAAGSVTANTFTGQQWYGIIKNHIVAGDYHQDNKFTVGATIPTKAGAALKVLTKSAPTTATILTGIVLDSNNDNTANGQVAVLDLLTAIGATPANNGYINAVAGVLSPL